MAESQLLKAMLSKYTEKGGHYGVLRNPRCKQYDEMLTNVMKCQTTATREELELAARLTIVKLINVEDLMFEIKQMKKFAEEVGLAAAIISKITKGEDLAIEIVKKLDAKKGYSNEFVKWYDGLPDEFLAKIEAGTTETKSAPASEDAIDVADLVAEIEKTAKISDLKAFIEDKDIAPLFEGFDSSKFKLGKQLQKAMVEFLNKPKETPKEDSSVDNAELVKAIQEAESDDELIAVMEAAGEVFAEFTPPEDVEELDAIKASVLEFLGVTPEEEKAPEPEPAKPMTLKEKLAAKRAAEAKAKEPAAPAADAMVIDFDPTDFDPEAVYEKADGLGIGQLKKFYSQVKNISKAEMESNKPGITKETLMDNLAAGLESLKNEGPKDAECVCPPAEGDSEITVQLVEKAAKAEDKDTLVAMCEKLGINLNALEKRNVNRMKTKILEKIPAESAKPAEDKPRRGRPPLSAKKTEEKAEAPITKDSKLVEIVDTIESAVLEGKAEKEIVDAATPLYKAMGKNVLKIKGYVKTLIEVVKVMHDIK